MTAKNGEMHTRDEDCTVGEDNTCTVCGVGHGDPCIDCGGSGFHRDSCPTLTPGRVGALVLAAAEVALDCEPGGEDDHAQDFGLAVKNYTSGEGRLTILLADDRLFRVTVNVEEIGTEQA